MRRPVQRALGASKRPDRPVLSHGDRDGDGGRPRHLDRHRLLPPRATPDSDPTQAAVAWLQAYRTLRYEEPVQAWVDRVRPVVTPALAATYEHSRAGAPGLDWQRWVARRSNAVVEDGVAIVAAQAPRTSDEVNVQVSATLRTSCATTDPRPGQASHT